MKRIILVFFTIFFVEVKATPSIGIGIVWIDFDESTVVELYQNPADRHVKQRIEFFYDKNVNSISIKNFSLLKKWLRPELIWLDYSQFNFRCKSQNENWFEVIVNNQDGSTLWIKRNEESKFETWEEYFKRMYAVARLNIRTQLIRELPADDAKVINYEGKDCFRVKSLLDEWIEIYSADYCDQKKTNIKSGWIRWRNADKLLIKYFTTS